MICPFFISAGAGRQGWFTFSIRNTRFDKRSLNIFITSCPLTTKKAKWIQKSGKLIPDWRKGKAFKPKDVKALWLFRFP